MKTRDSNLLNILKTTQVSLNKKNNISYKNKKISDKVLLHQN